MTYTTETQSGSEPLVDPAAASDEERIQPWMWVVLAVILAGDIMDLLDSLVTNVAGPTVMRDLHAGQTFIQWLAAAYTIAMAAGLLIGSRLGDRFGRRKMFLIGMAGFGLMSALSGLATDPAMLLTTRALQGLLGALMLPQGMGIVKEMFPESKAGKAFAMFGPAMGASAVAGPLLAGWLVDANLLGYGWRMIFWINVPIAIAAMIVGIRMIPRLKVQHSTGADVTGTLMAAAGMVALAFPLVQGRSLGWPWWCPALAVLGLGLLGAFGWWEVRQERLGRSTLIEPSLFRNRAFTGGSILGLFMFSALVGASLPLTLLLQEGLGFDPLHAGLLLAGQAAGMIVGFALSQALGSSPATMRKGMAASIIGILGILVSIWAQSGSIEGWWMLPGLIVTGAGLGTAMAPFADLIISGVSNREAGSASGAFTSIQQLGAALGVAILGSVFFSVLDSSHHTVADFGHAAEWSMLAAALLMVITLPLTRLLSAPESAQTTNQ